MSSMTPREIVQELDNFIIGQSDAKRAVAIALRNRWRRMQVDESLRYEITPKNILMIGPTGVGKTEIARRLAKLANAPFIKVEATKFTEVGYVGRDVEQMVRDLAQEAVKMAREGEMEKVKFRAEQAVEDRILEVLLPQARDVGFDNEPDDLLSDNPKPKEESSARAAFRKRLREGGFDEKEIELDVSAPSGMGMEIMAPPGMEDLTNQLQGMFKSLSGGKTKKRKLPIKMARKVLLEEESNKLINEEDIKNIAIFNVEQNGIIFIDEIDKISGRSGTSGADVSREGVQRDLLPLIEGSSVTTKYGTIKTDHILFIASGAFQLSKPSDLIPELQGRLPIRVELKSLTTEDFRRILKEPNAALTKQYIALLATEKVSVEFTDEAIDKIAKIAWQINDKSENIGARRLATVMERLFESLSYEASDVGGKEIVIDEAYVSKHFDSVMEDEDLTDYIL